MGITLRSEKGSKLTIKELDDNFRYILDNLGGTASENGKPKMYKLGKLDELQIMVDPYMRWVITK